MKTSAIMQVPIVAGYELMKYVRGRRLPGMLVLLGLIIGLILGLPPLLGLSFPSAPNEFVSSFAGFSSILAVLCGVLFASDALVSEYEKRTAYFLFPNPVRRETIVVGKLAASLAASGLVVTFYYVAAAAAAFAVTGGVTWEIFLSYSYTLAYMVSIVGVAYFISAWMKGTVSATVLTFFLFTLVFSIVQAVLLVSDVEPWFLPTAAAGIIGNVLSPGTDTGGSFGGGPGGGGAFQTFVPEVSTSLLLFALYFVAFSVAAVIRFKRRELVS